jgi:tRNA dimethylallyltransferase
MRQHNPQVVNQVGRLVDQVRPARGVGLAGRFDHFGRLFDDLGADLLDTAGQQLVRVRPGRRVGLAVFDHGHQAAEDVFTQGDALSNEDRTSQNHKCKQPWVKAKAERRRPPAFRPPSHQKHSIRTMPRAVRDCWFLTGPTASGKTDIGLELACRLRAEIVSLDSMALYRRLDIGTAKPDLRQRSAAVHHLIDLVEPDQEYSLAQYVEAAEAAAAEIQSRGREVLFVGGTPLYLKSLLRGIFSGPPADWQLRRRLEAEALAHGPDWLHDRLAQVDPVAAGKLHARDQRRLIRALEVHEKTGRPISELQQQFERARPTDACRVFVLDWPRATLYARIDARVDAMFAAGLVGEVQNLLAAGVQLSRTASQAVGYREVLEHLAGQRDLAATIELVKIRTRQFARRQLTWFRSLSECRPVGLSPDAVWKEQAAETAARIAALGAGL